MSTWNILLRVFIDTLTAMALHYQRARLPELGPLFCRFRCYARPGICRESLRSTYGPQTFFRLHQVAVIVFHGVCSFDRHFLGVAV